MLQVELITVPGSGTRSVEKWVSKQFAINNHPTKGVTPAPGTLISTHFEESAFQRILTRKNTLFLCTWRDPLRIVIHNMYKKRKDIMTCFHMLQHLRKHRPVIMIDLRCIPYHEGEWETLNPAARVENDNNALREAYARKDLEYIDKIIPDYLEWLRRFDWKDLWTESWWK